MHVRCKIPILNSKHSKFKPNLEPLFYALQNTVQEKEDCNFYLFFQLSRCESLVRRWRGGEGESEGILTDCVKGKVIF